MITTGQRGDGRHEHTSASPAGNLRSGGRRCALRRPDDPATGMLGSRRLAQLDVVMIDSSGGDQPPTERS
jgi:hypothetical protein